jgi:sugar phosphate isomerase/epimerase
MAELGVMMMMVKDQVAEQGMFAVLKKIKDLDINAVEVSQIPMSEENTADLERAISELGMKVGALSVALKPGPTATGDNLEEHFDKIVSDCRRLGTTYVRIGMMPLAAMASKEACESWAAECEAAAQRLAAEGITPVLPQPPRGPGAVRRRADLRSSSAGSPRASASRSTCTGCSAAAWLRWTCSSSTRACARSSTSRTSA